MIDIFDPVALSAPLTLVPSKTFWRRAWLDDRTVSPVEPYVARIMVDPVDKPWAEPMFARIDELSHLAYVWRRPFDRQAVLSAVRAVDRFMQPDTPVPSVTLTKLGGVQFDWHIAGIDLEIAVDPDDDPTVIFVDIATGREWEGQLPYDDVEVKAALVDVTERVRAGFAQPSAFV